MYKSMIKSNFGVDDIIDNIFNSSNFPWRTGYVTTVTDTTRTEADGTLTLTYYVPGVKADQLTIETENEHYLRVTSKRNGQEQWHRFSITGYDAETTDATLQDGVLTLVLKAYKHPETKKITIKVK